MRKYLIKILFVLLLFICLVPSIAQGQTVTIDNPLGYNDFWELIDKLIDFVFYLSIGIAPIMFTVAGFYFITAGGEPEKVNTAKKIILWTMVGLLIVLSAKGLISFFGQIFGTPTP